MESSILAQAVTYYSSLLKYVKTTESNAQILSLDVFKMEEPEKFKDFQDFLTHHAYQLPRQRWGSLTGKSSEWVAPLSLLNMMNSSSTLVRERDKLFAYADDDYSIQIKNYIEELKNA